MLDSNGSGSFPTRHPEDFDPKRSEEEGDEESRETLQPFRLQDELSEENRVKKLPEGSNNSVIFRYLTLLR